MTNPKQLNSGCRDDKSNRVRADLKKKMKKSRPLKLSNVESLRSSSPPKLNISLQGEPLPLPLPITISILENAATPLKQSIVKTTTVGSPHYMKSTTSFDARQEHSQVSPQTAKTASADKSARHKNLRPSIADYSLTKKRRTLTSSTSLKLARTLTNAPSFKHTSVSARKYSKVAVCAGVKSQKATCSSTLKELKFPSYLMLTPGGTELEGNSVMKVCPYAYCSLNGHFHTPLPPLKSFLSAKRRLLKAHKILKSGALPQRVSSVDEERIETRVGMTVSNGKPASQDDDLDFFIEIYAKNNNAVSERSETAINDGYVQDKFDSTKNLEEVDDCMFSAGDVNESIEVYSHEQDEESLSDGSPHSEIDYEESFDHKIDVNFFCEELKEDTRGDCASFFAREESALHYMDNGSNEKEIRPARSRLDSTDIDASHMEWEEGNFGTTYFYNQGGYTPQTAHEIDLGHMHQSRHGNLESIDGSNNKSDDANNYFMETIADDAFEDSLSTVEKGYTSEIDDHNSRLAPSASADGMNEELMVLANGNNVVSLIKDQIFNIDHQHDVDCTSTIADEVSKFDHQENDFQLDEDELEPHKKQIIDSIDERMANKVTTNESLLPKIEDVPTITASDMSTEQELQLHGIKINQEQTRPCKNLKRTIGSKRSIKERNEQRTFNPREPTYLPVKPDQEAEKIDLKHQPKDERKTAEEWMLDYALRQAVTKLAPARSRRVALLIEAFETVSPIPKYQTHMKHTSAVLTGARSLQICI